MTLVLEPAHERFVEQLGLLWESQGLSRIAGRVLGFLTLQDGPRNLDDIAGALAVSKGSVSHEARQLQQLNLVERVPAGPGDRRDYYVVRSDLPLTVLEHRARELDNLAIALEQALALPETPAVVTERLARFARFHRRVVSMLRRLCANVSRDQRERPT